MTLTSGTKLGPYEIQSPLGAGGMGEVYRARDPRLERTVAIKVLPTHLNANPELRARFERLPPRLARKPLTPDEVLKIATDVADALVKAHRSGIVHRDLKPGNVMLTKGGAKLMDFGLAKSAAAGAPGGASSAPLLSAARTMSQASPVSPLTTAGTMIGTIQYMSPEQIEGKEADARSDLFALGAVLYEMVTRARPL